MQPLVIEAPPTYQAERQYVYRVVLHEFLGLEYRIVWQPCGGVSISCGDDRQLEIADVLFSTPQEAWLTRASLPKQPLEGWLPPTELSACDWPLERLPVIFGSPCQAPGFFQADARSTRISIDIFGSCFFMLTRYEEVVQPQRDRLGRFPASESLAFQEGFLDRPIVDEYVELLWRLLRRLWPALRRKPRSYHVEPTHDLDRLRLLRRPSACLRVAAGDLVKRRSPVRAAECLLHGALAACGLPHRDRFATCDWLMDLSERHGCRSAFYIMATGEYRLDDVGLREAIRRIRARGHELGVHPNLGTDKDGRQLGREVRAVRVVLQEEGICPEALGGRQHCLSWRAPATWQHYEDAGLVYDATLGYADHAGFRCGTCHAYPAFNLLTRQPLRLYERPLLAMDCTVLGDKYMRLSHGQAAEYLGKLRQRVRQCQGSFRILWHNSWFNGRPQEFEFYRWLLEG